MLFGQRSFNKHFRTAKLIAYRSKGFDIPIKSLERLLVLSLWFIVQTLGEKKLGLSKFHLISAPSFSSAFLKTI